MIYFLSCCNIIRCLGEPRFSANRIINAISVINLKVMQSLILNGVLYQRSTFIQSSILQYPYIYIYIYIYIHNINFKNLVDFNNFKVGELVLMFFLNTYTYTYAYSYTYEYAYIYI